MVKANFEDFYEVPNLNFDISNETYRGYLEDHPKAEDFFDVQNYPLAVLKIHKENFIKEDKKSFDVNASFLCNLTIKGITHDINIPLDISVYNNHATASGNIQIDRTLYNITYKSQSFFPNIGDKLIYDNFYLNFQLHVDREWE